MTSSGYLKGSMILSNQTIVPLKLHNDYEKKVKKFENEIKLSVASLKEQQNSGKRIDDAYSKKLKELRKKKGIDLNEPPTIQLPLHINARKVYSPKQRKLPSIKAEDREKKLLEYSAKYILQNEQDAALALKAEKDARNKMLKPLKKTVTFDNRVEKYVIVDKEKEKPRKEEEELNNDGKNLLRKGTLRGSYLSQTNKPEIISRETVKSKEDRELINEERKLRRERQKQPKLLDDPPLDVDMWLRSKSYSAEKSYIGPDKKEYKVKFASAADLHEMIRYRKMLRRERHLIMSDKSEKEKEKEKEERSGSDSSGFSEPSSSNNDRDERQVETKRLLQEALQTLKSFQKQTRKKLLLPPGNLDSIAEDLPEPPVDKLAKDNYNLINSNLLRRKKRIKNSLNSISEDDQTHLKKPEVLQPKKKDMYISVNSKDKILIPSPPDAPYKN